MPELKELFQTADWKQEKHVPVIELPEIIKKGEYFKVTVLVGKDNPHPNTTEHHIRWIAVYFLPLDAKFPIQIGKFEFTAHGESTQGPNTSTVYTQPEVVLNFKTDKPGTIFSSSYCNIHGLWQSSRSIEVK
ncbi:MAG: class II SORL domain-containing protein [Candidatus Schekmanbacteria bacterium]|nr:class II SORL domain-containing protein [Candidatus Schekmanbacteria bacterium]